MRFVANVMKDMELGMSFTKAQLANDDARFVGYIAVVHKTFRGFCVSVIYRETRTPEVYYIRSFNVENCQ